jgi:transposase
LRDLRSISDADPDGQPWATATANTLLDAHDLATQTRTRATETLQPNILHRIHIRNHYHGALAEATPTTRTNTPPTRQTHTLITRFRHFEDTIQQFATHLTPPTNNEAERAVRPEKIQQPTSGGWRTRQGLTDFAIVQSYLDTTNGDVTNSTSSNNSPPPAPCNHQTLTPAE